MNKILVGGCGASQNHEVPWLVAGYRIDGNRNRKVRKAIAFAKRKNQAKLVFKAFIVMH
jgi:hypothetical protein